MKDNFRKSIYLSSAEFFALVQSRNIKDIVVFKDLLKEVPNERSVLLAVTDLIKKGRLENRGEALVMDNALKKLTEILGNTKFSLSMLFYNSCVPQKCVYICGDEVASLEMDASRQGFIRAEYMEYDEFVAELLSYDFIPAGSCEERTVDENNIARLVREYEKYEETGNTDVLFSVKRFSVNTPDIEVFLIRDVLSDAFLIRSADDMKVVLYSKDRLLKLFRFLGDRTKEEILGYDFG